MKAGDVLSFPPRAQLRTSGGSTCTQRIHLATRVAHTGSLLSGIDTERPWANGMRLLHALIANTMQT